MRIPEIKFGHLFAEHAGSENGVVLSFDKGDASVFGDRKALPLQFRLRRGVDEIQLAVLLDRRAGAAAAEHLVILIRYKGDRERRPVDKVRRREVAPVHGAPLGLVRIVLEEQVRLSVIEDRAVRVVGPPGRDGRVVFGSVAIFHCFNPPVRKICVKDGTVLIAALMNTILYFECRRNANMSFRGRFRRQERTRRGI